PLRLRHREGARARHARAAHGYAGLAARRRHRQAPPIPRPGLPATTADPFSDALSLRRPDPRQPDAAAPFVAGVSPGTAISRVAGVLARQFANGSDAARDGDHAALGAAVR